MIGVSILAAGQGDLCRQLADKDKGKRWQGVDAGRTRAGALFIRDAALSLECAVHAQYPAGDHEIFLLEIATFIAAAESDRKSGGWGKSVSVRVDLGGRRIMKKKNSCNSS